MKLYPQPLWFAFQLVHVLTLIVFAPQDKNAFAEILKKISKIQKTNGHNYVVLRDDKK